MMISRLSNFVNKKNLREVTVLEPSMIDIEINGKQMCGFFGHWCLRMLPDSRISNKIGIGCQQKFQRISIIGRQKSTSTGTPV